MENKYKTITGYLSIDNEDNPNAKDFDTALNEAVVDLYVPVMKSFRGIPIEGNILLFMLVERKTEPSFIGGKKSG